MKSKLAFQLLVITAALAAGISQIFELPPQQLHRFTALGDLAGGSIASAAYGVSADGSVVVGYSNSKSGVEAFRWTQRDGMVGLGFAEAYAVSHDGSAVAGFRCIAGRSEPVRWTHDDGPRGLGVITGCRFGQARGISNSGAVVVGTCNSEFGVGDVPFYWTSVGGLRRLESLPSNNAEADVYSVSCDGNVVVGAIRHEPGRTTAFRWTSTAGLLDLGALPGDTGSRANAISSDGSVVVGVSWQSHKAFRWTDETGMVDLGTLPGGERSCAFGANSNGSIVVGQSGSEFGLEAFVWDAIHGMRSVRQLLLSHDNLGTSLREWKLRAATAVSSDGSTVVGYGINPSGNREAWIAQIYERRTPELSTLQIADR